MRVVHETASGTETVADDVTVATTVFERMRGLMFRPGLEPGEGLVFEFGDVATRGIHSLFVFSAFDTVWVRAGTVEQVQTFRPFLGIGWASADVVVELPAGAAAEIEPGDTLRVEAANNPMG